MKNKTTLLAVILAALVVIAAVLWLVIGRGGETPTEAPPSTAAGTSPPSEAPETESAHTTEQAAETTERTDEQPSEPAVDTAPAGSEISTDDYDPDYWGTPLDYYIREDFGINDGTKSIDLEYQSQYAPLKLTLTVGAVSDFGRAVILNPHVEYNQKHRVGFYFVADEGEIIGDERGYINDDTMQQCYLIETFDLVHACDYRDPWNYGVCWAYEWTDKDICLVRMRIIDMDMSTMLGIVGIEMERVGESYRISRLIDLRETDSRSCELLKDLAFEQVRESRRYGMLPEIYMNNEVLIERIEPDHFTYYYGTLVSPFDQTKRTDGRVGVPVYAVTVNTLLPNTGYITWYFRLLNEPLVSDTVPPQFDLIGYDPMYPMSKERFDGLYYKG